MWDASDGHVQAHRVPQVRAFPDHRVHAYQGREGRPDRASAVDQDGSGRDKSAGLEQGSRDVAELQDAEQQERPGTASQVASISQPDQDEVELRVELSADRPNAAAQAGAKATALAVSRDQEQS